MSIYQITFQWPNGDWTWIDVAAKDFHGAMLLGLMKCPDGCRVHRIEYQTPAQAKANADYMRQRAL